MKNYEMKTGRTHTLTPIRTLYQYGYATSFYTNSGIVIRIFPKTHTSRLFWRLLTSPLDSSQKITPRDISPPCMSIVGSKRPTLPKITTHDAQTLVNFLRMQNPARPRGIGKNNSDGSVILVDTRKPITLFERYEKIDNKENYRYLNMQF